MSKWIDTLEDIYADGGDWEDMFPVFESIDKLLRRAMLETEDEQLHDDIEAEIGYEEKPQLITGVSSMVGITEEEIRKLFSEEANVKDE